MTDLAISIVTYAPDLAILAQVLERLDRALRHARQAGVLGQACLTVIDNGPGPTWRAPLQTLLDAAGRSAVTELHSGHGNIGYGAGHNLAFPDWSGAARLILNPDVLLEEDTLSVGLQFLADHPAAGLITPQAWGGDGQRQYLCKSYPSVLDFSLRGFAPGWLRRRFQTRLARYELRAQTEQAVFWDPPIASGCFMLCRQSVWARLAGFCPGYFLYFEDFDLSVRLAALNDSRLVYVPTVRIVHLGGHAARKGLRHILLFLWAAARFFQQHGWCWR